MSQRDIINLNNAKSSIFKRGIQICIDTLIQYSGKPDEDAEPHLLRTNDWMDTHRFQDHVKVQRFCLTLTREARLWYELLGLQNNFRQQYSKIGNTMEKLFHAWRSFHFNENAETIDA